MEILHTTVKMTQIMKYQPKKNDCETRITHAVQVIALFQFEFKSMKPEVVPRKKQQRTLKYHLSRRKPYQVQ